MLPLYHYILLVDDYIAYKTNFEYKIEVVQHHKTDVCIKLNIKRDIAISLLALNDKAATKWKQKNCDPQNVEQSKGFEVLVLHVCACWSCDTRVCA